MFVGCFSTNVMFILLILLLFGCPCEALVFNQNWVDFISDVWNECFMHTNVCKNIYTTFYASLPPSDMSTTREDDKILQHFSEQILFHRVRENMDAIYTTKHILYKGFTDFRDTTLQPDVDSQYADILQTIKDSMKTTKLWLYAFDALEVKIKGEIAANKSCEDTYQVILDTIKIQTAKLLADFQVNLFTKDLSIKTLVMSGSTKIDASNTKKGNQNIKVEKRANSDEQTQNNLHTISLARCSPNKYPVWNSNTNSFDCICYSDKNCLVDINTISEPDLIHPIIVIVLVVIMLAMVVRVYQSTSPIF